MTFLCCPFRFTTVRFSVSYVEVLKEVGAETVGYATYPRISQTPARPLQPPESSVGTSLSPGPRKGSLIEEGSDRIKYGDHVLKEFKTQVSQSPNPSPSGLQLRKNSIPKSTIDELLIPPPPTTSFKEELDLLQRQPER